jgi:hypothetical protein
LPAQPVGHQVEGHLKKSSESNKKLMLRTRIDVGSI